MSRDRRWDELDNALRAAIRQVRAAGLNRLTERELTDAVEKEKQARRQERRQQDKSE